MGYECRTLDNRKQNFVWPVSLGRELIGVPPGRYTTDPNPNPNPQKKDKAG